MLQHNPTTDQKAAVIARLLDALATVALCERWLELNVNHTHKHAADRASERMAAVAQEARA